MLVLTRRIGESIKIGKEVTVTVLALSGGQVRLGITARREIPIDREEIHRRKVREEPAEAAECQT